MVLLGGELREMSGRGRDLRAWELHQAGVVQELYCREDIPEVVLVLECDSTDAARTTLASLPLVQAGLINFDLIPLRAYDGFARLFSL